jgi:hypothetical protein
MATDLILGNSFSEMHTNDVVSVDQELFGVVLRAASNAAHVERVTGYRAAVDTNCH